MRRGSYNPNSPSCCRSDMKRLISLSLALCLAACVTETPTTPPDNGINGERKLCDDGSRYSFLNAQPIEFGKAYELSSGLVYFRAVTDRAGKVTLRLDNLPDYGYLSYRVLNSVQQAKISGSFSAQEAPIPPSATFTGEIDTVGAVFVRLEHVNFNLDDQRCPRYQFTLFRE